MTVEFLEIAYGEYKDAIEYYDLMELGLGKRFKEDFDLSLERIMQYPESWKKETESLLVR